jgi:hypothetical protein
MESHAAPIMKRGHINRLFLVFIVIGIGLFIAGVFQDNRYFQSLGIAISVGFEVYSRYVSMRKTDYDYFIKFHKHSKDIVKIIKNGFGEGSGILGNLTDEHGINIIQRPKEPEIEDIGSARDHLQYGYPEYWTLKDESVSDSKEILGKIQRVKDDFESRIVKEMEQKTGMTNSTLVRKTNYYQSGNELFQNCYYDDLISEIFYEIKMRKEGKMPRQLYLGFDFPTNHAGEYTGTAYKLLFGENCAILVRVKEEDSGEIKSRIEKLLLNSDVDNMIDRYITLKESLNANKKRSEFFQSIEGLFKSILFEGESLDKRGKCNLCPLEPY